MRRVLIPFGLLFVIAFASPAYAQGDRMLIDYIDTGKYSKDGLIRFYLDVLDRTNSVIPEQDKKKLFFFINEEPISGELLKGVDMTLFRDIKEPIAVGILFTNYGGFVPASTSEASLYDNARRGLLEFFKELRQNNDWVGVWLYNEEGNDNIVPFSSNIEGAAEIIEQKKSTRIEDIDDEGEGTEGKSGSDSKPVAPPFYRYFDQVATKMAELEDLPRRRILLVISDGLGEYDTKQKAQIDKKIKGIVERAVDAGIKIYSYGAMIQEEAFLPFLQTASERTYGVYVRIDQPEDLEGKIRELAPQIMKQYVVDITAPGLPSDEKAKFRIDGETPSGEKISAVYPKAIKLPETPTNWKRILVWIGIGVGSLVGLFLFIWIIKKIVAWRRNRPEPEEVVVERVAYDGPDRGKLRVKSGPLAGEIFHLTEDITTIGCIDGNTVVIYDEGVSKRHAGIKIEEMRYELADFGSTNGTWVNGRKINKQFLRDGDEIRIGNTEMTFTLK